MCVLGVFNTQHHFDKYCSEVYVRKKLDMLLRVVTSPHSLNPPVSRFCCSAEGMFIQTVPAVSLRGENADKKSRATCALPKWMVSGDDGYPLNDFMFSARKIT